MACNELHETGDTQLPRDVARWFASRKLRPNTPTLIRLGVSSCNDLKLVSRDEWYAMMNSLNPPLLPIQRRVYEACIEQVLQSPYDLLAGNHPWNPASSGKGTPSRSQVPVRGRTSDATPRVGASVEPSTSKGKRKGLAKLWKSVDSPVTNVRCEPLKKHDNVMASPPQIIAKSI